MSWRESIDRYSLWNLLHFLEYIRGHSWRKKLWKDFLEASRKEVLEKLSMNFCSNSEKKKSWRISSEENPLLLLKEVLEDSVKQFWRYFGFFIWKKTERNPWFFFEKILEEFPKNSSRVFSEEFSDKFLEKSLEKKSWKNLWSEFWRNSWNNYFRNPCRSFSVVTFGWNYAWKYF